MSISSLISKCLMKAERIVMQNSVLYRCLKKQSFKKNESLCSVSEAYAILSSAYPKPVSKFPTQEHRWIEVSTLDISVIIPCYQAERFIEDCVNSCLNQDTGYRFEVIVMVDGSTDRSGDILESMKERDNRLKVFYQENKGYFGAVQNAVSYSSGEALVFVDSDDMLKPGALEMLGNAYRQSGCDVVTASYDNITENGKLIIPIIGRRKYGSLWARIFSRDIWRNLQLSYRLLYGDTIYSFCIEGRYSEIYLDKSVYLYRHNRKGISKTVQQRKCGIDSFWMVEILLNKTKELGIPYDQRLHNRVIFHLGPLLYDRCAALDEQEKKALFVCSCDLLKRWGVGFNCTLGERWSDLERALREENYMLWKLTA